jgi:hypothetical protein
MNQIWNIDEVFGHDLVLMLCMVQVQPDMEELTENAEDGADEAESKQSEVKLGRLQYKVS